MHPRNSSYQLDDYGGQSSLTAHLVELRTFLDLGDTPRERPKRYGQLCDLHLRKVGLIDERPSEEPDDLSVIPAQESGAIQSRDASPSSAGLGARNADNSDVLNVMERDRSAFRSCHDPIRRMCRYRRASVPLWLRPPGYRRQALDSPVKVLHLCFRL